MLPCFKGTSFGGEGGCAFRRAMAACSVIKLERIRETRDMFGVEYLRAKVLEGL